MIWQSFNPHRPAPTPCAGRRTTRRAAARRRRGWSRVTPAQRTVREPESGWWRACEQWDAEERATGQWDAGPVPDRPAVDEQDQPVVTVALVAESETGWNTDAVVLRLAQLAVNDELLVVYGRTGPGQLAVMAGMRGRLPRHHIVQVDVRNRAEVRRETGTVLEQLVEEGSVPVVITSAAAMHGISAEISSRLDADRVVRVFRTPTGADLQQVWQRRPAPSPN